MDLLKIKDRVLEGLQKYKFALLIFVVGLCLLMLPTKAPKTETETGINTPQDNILSVEESLSEILSMIQGAGKVRVLLTLASGEEILYQTDTSSTTREGESSVKTETVTINGGSNGPNGLVRQVNPPIYLGALIVCQGADSPAVRLGIVEAVSRVTGLSSDKISVLKMK